LRNVEQKQEESSVLSEELLLLNNEVSWDKILEVADHNELSLKYLREMGYDIGNL
jgi:hypothetical protein